MSFLKNVGDKAKGAASAAASKSQDMVEISKLKKKISNLEGFINDAKTKIGELTFSAHVEDQEFPMEAIKEIHAEIDEKLKEIEALNTDIENVKLGKAQD